MVTKRKKGADRRLRPLTVSASFKSFVMEQLEELGDVTPRSMFGGVGLYHRETFFGIIARDVLYLKVDGTNRADYERADMPPFQPYRGRSATMQYYAVPVDVLESAAELAVWARKAVAAGEAGASRPHRGPPLKRL